MPQIVVGARVRGKEVREVVRLSNGWLLIKTENGKSERDFRVKLITQTSPRIRSVTPKHAHFLIDYYGKKCASEAKAGKLFRGIIDVWKGRAPSEVLAGVGSELEGLPGYPPEYILNALGWILDQEDINYTGRPEAKQTELDATLRKAGVEPLSGRQGSELAISLFCNVSLGLHPVEAFIRAQLDVIPVKRARGAI